MNGQIIIIEGIMCSGKSTFCRSILHHSRALLGAAARVDVLLEHVDSVFLQAYIADQRRYAFDFQIYMARNRIETLRRAQRLAAAGHTVVIDRGLIGDIVFALMHRSKGNFTTEQWNIYGSVISDAFPSFAPNSLIDSDTIAAVAAGGSSCRAIHQKNYTEDALPDARYVVVHLKTTAERAFARLQERANPAEVAGYTLDYFSSLKTHYDFVLDEFAKQSMAVVDIDYDANASVDASSGLLSETDTCAVWHLIFTPDAIAFSNAS